MAKLPIITSATTSSGPTKLTTVPNGAVDPKVHYDTDTSALVVEKLDAPVFTSDEVGLVPASGGGTTNYLRADGTWSSPAGAGTVSFAQEYFVAKNGDDTTGDGSLSKPFLTIGKAVEVANAVTPVTTFLKINVAAGVFSESFSVTRPNIIIQGASNNSEERFSKIAGTVTVNSTGATGGFNQQVALAGFYIESATTSPAVRFTGTGTETLVIDGCIVTVTNAAANVLWCDATNATRPIVVVRNSNILHQASAPSASIVKLDYGDVRFDSVRVYTSFASGTGYGVEVLNSATLWAERMLIDITTTSAALFGSGTSASQKFLITNSGITQRGDNANAHAISVTNGSIPTNIAAIISECTLTAFNASAKAINGTLGSSLVYHGLISYGPNTVGAINSSTGSGVTLAPFTHKLGNLDTPLTAANGGTGFSTATINSNAAKVLTAQAGGTWGWTTLGSLATKSSISNTDVASDAAIERSKLAAGTAGHVVINNPSTGAFSSEAQLGVSRGGTGMSAPNGYLKGDGAGSMSATYEHNDLIGTLGTPDVLAFDTTPTVALSAAGQVGWDSSANVGTLSVRMDGGVVDAAIGQSTYHKVFNATGGVLAKGTVVYVSGAQGDQIAVSKAQATSDSTSATIIGVVAEEIASATDGFVITEGLLTGLNGISEANGFVNGTPVWLSPSTAGAIVPNSQKPVAPNHLVLVGYCVRRSNGAAGEILVKIQNGYELEELHDVLIGATGNALANEQFLMWDSVGTVWKNSFVPQSSVTGLSDALGDKAATTYVDSQDTATLASANSFAEGLAYNISSKAPVHVTTTAALPTYTFSGNVLTASANGPLANTYTDNHTLELNQRVLVKDEVGANQKYNGIYYLSQVGVADTSPWKLTRTEDANSAGEICGSTVPVETGATNSGTLWLFSANSATFVLNTDPVVWNNLTVTVPNASNTVAGKVQLAGAFWNDSANSYTAPSIDLSQTSYLKNTLSRALVATGTAYNLVYNGSEGALTELAVGTAGYILKSTATGPAWDSVSNLMSGYLLASNNLSELTDTTTARSNLGLGTMATEAASSYAALAGATFTGKLNLPASTTSAAALNLLPGTAPTSPTNGDLWTTTTTVNVRLDGTTRTLAQLADVNTWTSSNTFSATSNSFGTNTGTGTTNVATGATLNGSTKTVNIGTNGVAGSITDIAIGATSGTSTTTLNGTVNATTAPVETNTTQVATTAFVKAQGYLTSVPAQPYDISGEAVGAVSSADVIMRFFASRTCTVSAGTYTGARCLTAPTGSSATFDIKKTGGGTAVGTITFTAGSSTGTVSIASDVSLVGETDYLTIECTAANGIATVFTTLKGTA